MQDSERVLRQMLNFSMAWFLGVRARRMLLNGLGLKLAADAKISRGTRLGGSNISFGDGSGANEECWIDDHVAIGRRVRLGPRVMIITGTHPTGQAEQRRGAADVIKPVIIGDGTWIHTGAVVLPGAHVASGCVVYANAVVTKPTKPNGAYAGVPARRIADLPHGKPNAREGGRVLASLNHGRQSNRSRSRRPRAISTLG